MVATAVERMGKDGVIAVEESGSSDFSIEYKDGMAFDKGYTSRYFVTDAEKQEAVLEDPYILVTDKKIDNLPEFVAFADMFGKATNGAPIVIIAESIGEKPLEILAINTFKGNIKALAIEAPGYGEYRKAVLEDIAVLTGATFITADMGSRLDSVTVEQLGRAKRITSTATSTLIVDGLGGVDSIASRVESLQNQLEKTTRDFDRERLQERLAKLSSGIAIINVGAVSEAEMREKKERVIDAIAATKAAKDAGIVPGGETALLRVSDSLNDIKLPEQEQIGVEIVRRAITQPFKRLMENSGYEPGEMIALFKSEALSKNNYGIDVIDGKVKDLVASGVIDPVKVTRSALKNASSVAIMIITTNTLISYEKGTTEERN